jgi:hypothetical protein
MCPCRIAVLRQPTLPLPDMSVPEATLWPALPDGVRSRALVLLADLVARHTAGAVTAVRHDAGVMGAQEPVAGGRGGCR